jgi:O-antigen ligase
MWLLIVMILLMPYEANPYLYIAENLAGIFPDFTLIKALGLLGFAWAALKIASGDTATELLASRPAKLFLLFFCGVVFAGAFSGTGFVAISRYLAFLLFLPFVLVSVRTLTDLKRVLMTMVLAYVLVFPYAVRQMMRFGQRLGVGLYETNYLATIIVLVIPLAFVFAYQQRDQLRRVLWTGAGFVLVTMLFMTSSRGGFVGLLVAGMVFIYRRRGALAAVTVVCLLVVSIFVLPTDLGTRAIATIFDEHSQELTPGLEQSNRAHVALFWAALRMIADNPLFGVGPLNFKSLSTQYTGLQVANIAHNSFLEIAAEFGLPMLAIFLVLLVSTFRILRRATRVTGSREADELAGWAEGLRSGLIGFLVAGWFISAQYEKMFWLSIFVTITVGHFARAYTTVPAADEAPEGAMELTPAPQAWP